MSTKEETALQRRIVKLIESRGGYVKNNTGGMISVKGLADLSFTYKGFSLYWEVKVDTQVSVSQGIHCRLARKAGAFTAIIKNKIIAELILNSIDYCVARDLKISEVYRYMELQYKGARIDDGTKH